MNVNETQEQHQPSQKEYVLIAIILAVLTAIEVAIYYIYQIWQVFIVLAAVKFALVAMYFMHLKSDNKFFSIVFITGIFVAVLVFAVFLTFLRVLFH